MVKRWYKNRIGYVHLSYEDIYDFDSFVTKVLETLKEKQEYSLLLKINYNKDKYGMVGDQIAFSYEDDEDLDSFENVYRVFQERIGITLENYDVYSIDSFQLLYVLVEDFPELKIKNINKIGFNKEFNKIKDTKDRFNFIPLTTDMAYFGKLIISESSLYLTKINKHRKILGQDLLIMNENDRMYLYKDFIIINKTDIENTNTIYRGVYDCKSGYLIQELVDSLLEDNKFNRQIGNTILTIRGENVIRTESKKVLSPIKFTRTSLKDESNPFIGSWDIEAFDDVDGYAKVYALGFATLEKGSKMYYLDNDNTSEKLVIECLNDMLVNEYNGYIFYTHNFGKYDSIFLMKILKEENIRLGYEHYKTNDISRDGKILKLTIKTKRNLSDRKPSATTVRKDPGYNTITIIDSLNLLNQSLSKLGRSFDVPVTKGYFPYSFVKRETLHYVGNTPDYKYWDNVSSENKLSLEDYNKLFQSNWNLKNECLSYLDRDLMSLVMIMSKFSAYINRKYHLQVTDSLTISRLALNIFLKDYLKDSKLPIINKGMFNDIKQAYYGGVTEVYKPYGTNLIQNDVNSLYPYAALNDMPGIDCTYIDNLGNTSNLDNLFGYFYCEIKTGDGYLGLLPVHHKEGMIMPNGTWKGWYFSEELKFAVENGYSVDVIKGYNFNRVSNVFTNYVTDLYNIKCSTLDKVERDIVKRLLNHLLGRFGLNIVKPTTKCVNGEELSLIFSTNKVIGKPEIITEDDFRVTYIDQIDKDICEDHGIDYIKAQRVSAKTDMEKVNQFRDVSLTTAAAVTAYARIYMSKVKLGVLNKGGNVYYTDTDSIVTDIPLDADLVGNELGKFKVEYKIKEGYYISNKTYGVSLLDKIMGDNGKETSYVMKSKAILKGTLDFDSFKAMYKGSDIKATKRTALRDFYKGSVVLKDDQITLKHDSYTKRSKVFKRGMWIDTKPLVLEKSPVEKKYFNPKLVRYGHIKTMFMDFLYKLCVFTLIVLFTILGMEYSLDLYINDKNISDTNYTLGLDDIIEAKYNDDYMEEPVYIEYYNYKENKSWWKSFLDLFINKRSSIDRGIEHPNELLVRSDVSSYNNENLVNSSTERPQVLKSVLIHHIESLTDEIRSIKEGYSMSEFKNLVANKTLNDALLLCDKALRGSPIFGSDSPLIHPTSPNIQRSTGFESSPSLHLYTSFENSPIANRDSPILSRITSPFLNKDSPRIGSNSPFIGKNSIVFNKDSPFLDKKNMFVESSNTFTNKEELGKMDDTLTTKGLFIDTSSNIRDSVSTCTYVNTSARNSLITCGCGSPNSCNCSIYDGYIDMYSNFNTEHNQAVYPRKYPIRSEESSSLVRRYGNIWSERFNVESPSTIKRYGWVTPAGNSVLEEHSPLAKRHGHVFSDTFTLKKDYHLITEYNNEYKILSPYSDVE